MTHCRVPPEPSVRARARDKRLRGTIGKSVRLMTHLSLIHSIGRCVRVEEERQRQHTTYTYNNYGRVVGQQNRPACKPPVTQSRGKWAAAAAAAAGGSRYGRHRRSISAGDANSITTS
ncbi:hypothetical protein EVAR_5264_1 [Eumeta japonica]|uniref:Uncharacterized protein n=1 Tax=Eumeta variegata TaxID=151549 RepID=A0A4C1XNQ7_EUMVA|nr:hypothetical protein EVAR_5264_1 [Eumeta japonica]